MFVQVSVNMLLSTRFQSESLHGICISSIHVRLVTLESCDFGVRQGHLFQSLIPEAFRQRDIRHAGEKGSIKLPKKLSNHQLLVTTQIQK